VLGHAQQGGNPTPFDRNMGTKFGVRALEHLLEQVRRGQREAATSPDTATLIGLIVRYFLLNLLLIKKRDKQGYLINYSITEMKFIKTARIFF
jgi:hypothetical protein